MSERDITVSGLEKLFSCEKNVLREKISANSNTVWLINAKDFSIRE